MLLLGFGGTCSKIEKCLVCSILFNLTILGLFFMESVTVFFLDLDPDSGRRKKISESVSGLKDPDTKHFFNIGSVGKYFVDLCDIVDVIVVVLSLISVVEPKTER